MRWTFSAISRRLRALAALDSVLLVPVHEIEPALFTWSAHAEPLHDGVGAHVTTLYPFLPSRRLRARDDCAIRSVTAETDPWDFTLTTVGRFPQGVLYLAPEPTAPFVSLTERMHQAFPSCVPYGGAFDSIVPHVTVAIGATAGTPGNILEQRLWRLLPLQCRAREVHLLTHAFGRWGLRVRYPLGANTGFPG